MLGSWMMRICEPRHGVGRAEVGKAVGEGGGRGADSANVRGTGIWCWMTWSERDPREAAGSEPRSGRVCGGRRLPMAAVAAISRDGPMGEQEGGEEGEDGERARGGECRDEGEGEEAGGEGCGCGAGPGFGHFCGAGAPMLEREYPTLRAET
jgi:hypothetical protein